MHCHDVPELRCVVGLDNVGQFMSNEIVHDPDRRLHDAPVESELSTE
jgi:hypothetical protein